MATVNDSYTQLNTNTTSGDTMDESAPDRSDGEVRKRARVVLTGDREESAVADLIRNGGVWCLPVVSPGMMVQLQSIVDLLEKMNRKLAKLSGSLE